MLRRGPHFGCGSQRLVCMFVGVCHSGGVAVRVGGWGVACQLAGVAYSAMLLFVTFLFLALCSPQASPFPTPPRPTAYPLQEVGHCTSSCPFAHQPSDLEVPGLEERVERLQVRLLTCYSLTPSALSCKKVQVTKAVLCDQRDAGQHELLGVLRLLNLADARWGLVEDVGHWGCKMRDTGPAGLEPNPPPTHLTPCTHPLKPTPLPAFIAL